MKYTLLAIGISLLWLCFECVKVILRDRRRSLVEAVGTVVELEQDRDGEGYISYTPIYEYTYAGKTYRGKHRISSATFGKGMKIVPATNYPVGSQIPLLVDEEAPTFSSVNDSSKLMVFPAAVLSLVVGCACLVASIRMFD